MVCEWCDREFIGRKRKFCSADCRWKAINRRRHPLSLEKSRAKQRLESKNNRVCEQCGCHFKYKPGGANTRSGSGGLFCSKTCYVKARNKGKIRYSKVCFCECPTCSAWFRSIRNEHFCSDKCRKASAARKFTEYNKKKTSGPRRTIKCITCGVQFSRLYGCKSKCCSDKCSKSLEAKIKRIARATRRTRKRENGKAERFDPIEILDRDKWKCQACGVRTPKSKRGTYAPNAPELDHIIPLSKGGEHSRLNTQCLCRSCNGAKGDGSLSDQLILLVA